MSFKAKKKYVSSVIRCFFLFFWTRLSLLLTWLVLRQILTSILKEVCNFKAYTGHFFRSPFQRAPRENSNAQGINDASANVVVFLSVPGGSPSELTRKVWQGLLEQARLTSLIRGRTTLPGRMRRRAGWTIRGQVSHAEAQLLTHSSPGRALQLPLTKQQVNMIEFQIRK